MKNHKLTPKERAAQKRLLELWNRKRREGKIKTQEQLAEKLGLTQSGVNQYLLGYIPLNLPVVLKFAWVLECTPSEIFPDIIDYDIMQIIERGFQEGSDDDREVMMIAEEISSLPPTHRAALREYLKAIADKGKNQDDQQHQTGTL